MRFLLRRINLIRALFLGAGLVLLVRLFQLQVLDHTRYAALARQQHNLTVPLQAQRGQILTSDNFPLATNEVAFLVYVVPPEVENLPQTAGQLAEILVAGSQSKEEQDDEISLEDLHAQEKKRLEELLSLKERLWVALAHQVSPETKQKIEELKLAGVYFEEEQKRVYPEGNLAAHVLGFVGKNEQGEDWGYYGLEGFYQGDLAGQDGAVFLQKDVSGKPIPISQTQRLAPVNGRTLILTLNRSLQYLLEQRLKQGVEKYGAENGSVLILEPQTGRVLALANYPPYNPQNWQAQLKGENDVSRVEVFRNQAISVNYEPGSVFKAITMAAALETETVTEQTIFEDNGPLTFSGYQVRTWDNKYHGKIKMAQILQLSNNTGAAWLAHQLGEEKFARFLEIFNLGEKTGVDLQGEDRGIIRSQSEWREIDLANMGFGQGIALTPFQLTTAYAAIANQGQMMKPFLVEKIIERNGEEIWAKPEALGQVIKPETAFILQEMLQSVVDQGEFRWFVQQSGLDHYQIAGKTGTAQIPEGGRYNPHKTNVTFVGSAPTHQAKFVMLLKLTRPTASTYSAETAVPLWLEMAKDVLVHFNLAPSK